MPLNQTQKLHLAQVFQLTLSGLFETVIKDKEKQAKVISTLLTESKLNVSLCRQFLSEDEFCALQEDIDTFLAPQKYINSTSFRNKNKIRSGSSGLEFVEISEAEICAVYTECLHNMSAELTNKVEGDSPSKALFDAIVNEMPFSVIEDLKAKDLSQKFPPYGNTVLHQAIESRRLDVVTALVKSRRIDITRIAGQSNLPPLDFAIFTRNPEVINYLVNEGAPLDVCTKSYNFRSAFMLTILQMSRRKKTLDGVLMNMVERLKEDYTPVEQSSSVLDSNKLEGGDAELELYTAVVEGNQDQVRRILNENPGIDLSKRHQRTGKTVLHVAVAEGKTEIVTELLKEDDIDIDARDFAGNTALHVALMAENDKDKRDFARKLLDHNADINIPNKQGETPLMLLAVKLCRSLDKDYEEEQDERKAWYRLGLKMLNNWMTLGNCKPVFLNAGLTTETSSTNNKKSRFAANISRSVLDSSKLLISPEICVGDSRPRIPKTVILVLDQSGSMDNSRNHLLKKALVNEIFPKLHDDDKLVMIGFSDRARVIPSCTGNVGSLRSGLNPSVLNKELIPNGRTNLEAGFNLAKDYIEDVGNTSVVVLTDGDINLGLGESKQKQDLQALLNILKKNNRSPQLIPVCLSTDVGLDFVESLANLNGGKVIPVPNEKELKNAFAGLSGLLSSTLINDISVSVEVIFDNNMYVHHQLDGQQLPTNENYSLKPIALPIPTDAELIVEVSVYVKVDENLSLEATLTDQVRLEQAYCPIIVSREMLITAKNIKEDSSLNDNERVALWAQLHRRCAHLRDNHGSNTIKSALNTLKTILMQQPDVKAEPVSKPVQVAQRPAAGPPTHAQANRSLYTQGNPRAVMGGAQVRPGLVMGRAHVRPGRVMGGAQVKPQAVMTAGTSNGHQHYIAAATMQYANCSGYTRGTNTAYPSQSSASRPETQAEQAKLDFRKLVKLAEISLELWIKQYKGVLAISAEPILLPTEEVAGAPISERAYDTMLEVQRIIVGGSENFDLLYGDSTKEVVELAERAKRIEEEEPDRDFVNPNCYRRYRNYPRLPELPFLTYNMNTVHKKFKHILLAEGPQDDSAFLRLRNNILCLPSEKKLNFFALGRHEQDGKSKYFPYLDAENYRETISDSLYKGTISFDDREEVACYKIPSWGDHETCQLTDEDLVQTYEILDDSTRFTIVHCSAGIGRTGTLILAYFLAKFLGKSMLEMDPTELASHVASLLTYLRQRRPGLVQSSDQLAMAIDVAGRLVVLLDLEPQHDLLKSENFKIEDDARESSLSSRVEDIADRQSIKPKLKQEPLQPSTLRSDSPKPKEPVPILPLVRVNGERSKVFEGNINMLHNKLRHILLADGPKDKDEFSRLLKDTVRNPNLEQGKKFVFLALGEPSEEGMPMYYPYIDNYKRAKADTIRLATGRLIVDGKKVKCYKVREWEDNQKYLGNYNFLSLWQLLDNSDKYIVVHCSANFSRTATLLLAYMLLKTYGRSLLEMSEDEIHQHVECLLSGIVQQRFGVTVSDDQKKMAVDLVKEFTGCSYRSDTFGVLLPNEELQDLKHFEVDYTEVVTSAKRSHAEQSAPLIEPAGPDRTSRNATECEPHPEMKLQCEHTDESSQSEHTQRSEPAEPSAGPIVSKDVSECIKLAGRDSERFSAANPLLIILDRFRFAALIEGNRSKQWRHFLAFYKKLHVTNYNKSSFITEFQRMAEAGGYQGEKDADKLIYSQQYTCYIKLAPGVAFLHFALFEAQVSALSAPKGLSAFGNHHKTVINQIKACRSNAVLDDFKAITEIVSGNKKVEDFQEKALLKPDSHGQG